MTDAQFERLKRDWTKIAGEAMEYEIVGGAVYAFGSEVATLRLLKAYRRTEQARQNFSKNLKKFYFSLEV